MNQEWSAVDAQRPIPKTRPQNPRFFFGSAAGGVGVAGLGCATVSGAGTGAATAGAAREQSSVPRGASDIKPRR